MQGGVQAVQHPDVTVEGLSLPNSLVIGTPFVPYRDCGISEVVPGLVTRFAVITS